LRCCGAVQAHGAENFDGVAASLQLKSDLVGVAAGGIERGLRHVDSPTLALSFDSFRGAHSFGSRRHPLLASRRPQRHTPRARGSQKVGSQRRRATDEQPRRLFLIQQEHDMSDKKTNELAEALKANPEPQLEDQGDIAADDAGATAAAERVTNSASVQGAKQGE
jgi:hypothetical protein